MEQSLVNNILRSQYIVKKMKSKKMWRLL